MLFLVVQPGKDTAENFFGLQIPSIFILRIAGRQYVIDGWIVIIRIGYRRCIRGLKEN